MLKENRFEIIHLFDLLAMAGGEALFKDIANSFHSVNKDVNQFFKEKAIQSTKLNTSSTYIIVSTDNSVDVLGYFTLAIKMLSLKKKSLSKTEQKIIARFGYYDANSKSYKIPAILIAQLSKNFNKNSKSIKGSDLMDIILKQVKSIFQLASGKIVFLECENNQNLIDFYTFYGFHFLDTEKKSKSNTELVQLYRLL